MTSLVEETPAHYVTGINYAELLLTQERHEICLHEILVRIFLMLIEFHIYENNYILNGIHYFARIILNLY